ncbi:MAG: radical SAM protein [Clostridia bacterium]|nr:radical SAM protein [Clostridia bacterium]
METQSAVHAAAASFKLFKSPRNYYLYSVYLDSVIRISEEIFLYLKKESKSPLSPEAEAELHMLRAQNALTPTMTNKIRHPAMDRLHDALETRLGQLCLQVTQFCNLVCLYCAYANITDGTTQRNHSAKKMDLETAKRAVDFYYEHSWKRNKCAISFYGGEPLIAFDLIKEVILYAEKRFLGKKLTFNMTTNGTLLTEEMMDFLAAHEVAVMFSIDGPKKIHDNNRKRADGTGSFSAACENLKKMWKKYEDAGITSHLSVNMVLHPKNDLDDVFELFDDPFFANDIVVRGGRATEEYLEEKLEQKPEFFEKSAYQYFLCWLDLLNIVENVKVSPIFRTKVAGSEESINKLNDLMEGLPDEGAPGGPCVPGERRLFVNTDGDFFPCEKVSELEDVLKIGNLSHGFDEEKAAAILDVATLTAEKCRSCWAFRHCGVCARTCVKNGELSKEARLKNCGEQMNRTADLIGAAILYQECKSVYTRGD